jgi:hypothetical protein
MFQNSTTIPWLAIRANSLTFGRFGNFIEVEGQHALRTENRSVGSSILPLGTSLSKDVAQGLQRRFGACGSFAGSLFCKEPRITTSSG